MNLAFLWCYQADCRYGWGQVIYVRCCIDNWCSGHTQRNMVGSKEKCAVGRVGYGTGLPEAEDDLAIEVLVIMIFGIPSHWKHQIAYFLQNKISASVQPQLINDCIDFLHWENWHVMALVLMVHIIIKAQQQSLAVKWKSQTFKLGFPIHRSPAQRFMLPLMHAIWLNWWEVFWVTKGYFVMRKLASNIELIDNTFKHSVHEINHTRAFYKV